MAVAPRGTGDGSEMFWPLPGLVRRRFQCQGMKGGAEEARVPWEGKGKHTGVGVGAAKAWLGLECNWVWKLGRSRYTGSVIEKVSTALLFLLFWPGNCPRHSSSLWRDRGRLAA